MPTAWCCATTKAKSSSIPKPPIPTSRDSPRRRKKLKSRSWSSFRKTKTRRGGATNKRKRFQRSSLDRGAGEAGKEKSRRAFFLPPMEKDSILGCFELTDGGFG